MPQYMPPKRHSSPRNNYSTKPNLRGNDSNHAPKYSQIRQEESGQYSNQYSNQAPRQDSGVDLYEVEFKPKQARNNMFSIKSQVVETADENASTLFHGESGGLASQGNLTESAVDFLCNHYEVTTQVREILTARFQNQLTKTDRDTIFSESYNDIIEILDNAGLMPIKELRNDYVRILIADVVGFGILEPLLDDPETTEIMVVDHDKIFTEKNGKVEWRKEFKFPSIENAKGIAKRIVEPLGKRLDTLNPNVDAQMPDGSRLSASIAPMRLNDEISITIRKFSEEVYPLNYYAEKYGSETNEMVDFIMRCVKSRQSIMVSGGTGSGKTTLLNSVSFAIPENERILTLEDTPELRLQQPNVEGYQTVEANQDGKGGFTIQQLMIAALRKRPDRIIVGECRGGEIVEMFSAMNTGHEGSMSTVHANSPEDMIQRCVTMVRSNPATSSLDERTIHEMLNSALALIVQTTRLQDGSRRVVNITEVVGVGQQGAERLAAKGIKLKGPVDMGRLYLQDVFRFIQTGVDEKGKVHGYFEATGYVPYCNDVLVSKGNGYKDEFFRKRKLMEV